MPTAGKKAAARITSNNCKSTKKGINTLQNCYLRLKKDPTKHKSK